MPERFEWVHGEVITERALCINKLESGLCKLKLCLSERKICLCALHTLRLQRRERAGCGPKRGWILFCAELPCDRERKRSPCLLEITKSDLDCVLRICDPLPRSSWKTRITQLEGSDPLLAPNQEHQREPEE